MKNELEQLRQKINKIDKEIILKINKRLDFVKKIGEFKKKNIFPIKDAKREEELNNLYKKWSKELNLNEKIIIKIFNLIIAESKRIQK
ncbi:MAG: chorismate mutase [Patescibacteria group bacterium]